MPTNHIEAANTMRQLFLTDWIDWITNGKPVDIRNPSGARLTPIELKDAIKKQSYVPEIRWENVSTDEENDHSRHWLRFRSYVTDTKETGMRTGTELGRKARYTEYGIIVVQMFFAKAALAGNQIRELSVIARDIYRPRNLLNSPVWYRNAAIDNLQPEERYFRSNIVANYQFDEIV